MVRRVLIVDEEITMRLTLSYLLRKIGYVVTACASAAEALELARSAPHLVVLGDLLPSSMETLDGPGILVALKRESPASRILVLTAERGPEVRQIAMAQGADGFCEKPMDLEKLLLAIKSLEPST